MIQRRGHQENTKRMALNSLSFSSLSTGEYDSASDEIFQIYELEDEPSPSKLEKILSQPVKVKDKIRKKKYTKRPSTNPAYMPALRILRRDIRRKYCEMINNVVNNFDPTLMLQFFRHFSIPNVKRVLHYPTNTLQTLHQTSIITGIEEQVKYLSMNYKLMPDIIFALTDVKVCKSSNSSGSRVVARTSVRGTLLYSARNKTKNGENVDLIDCDAVTTRNEVIEGVTDDVILHPLETPLDYEMNGIITLHLDDQHRMVLIEIQSLDCQLSSSLSTMRIN